VLLLPLDDGILDALKIEDAARLMMRKQTSNTTYTKDTHRHIQAHRHTRRKYEIKVITTTLE
jgi:hypothetical protein